MAVKYIQLYHDTLDTCVELNDQQFGRLIRAMLLYSESGIAPELKGVERHYIPRFMQDIDRFHKAYAEKCQKSREAANMRWHTDVCQDKDKDKDKDKDNSLRSKTRTRGKRLLKNNSEITLDPKDLFVPVWEIEGDQSDGE